MQAKKLILTLLLLIPSAAWAQYQGTERPVTDTALVISLDDALKIALSENTSVKVADMEIQRQKYARKGAYGALFPQINASGMYSYAIQKQKVFFGSDDNSSSGSSGGGMASMMAGLMEPIMYYIEQLYVATGTPFIPYVPEPSEETTTSSSDPIEMGRRNQVQFGLSAAMPLVNLQLWESLRITGDQVELAVEKARESRLGTVASVKQAYFAVLMAKASYEVYNAVFENAAHNLKLTESRYNVQKASEMDLARAKSTYAAAIPNVYNAENSIRLGLWQLKAVMGLDLDRAIDVQGCLSDYTEHMFYDIHEAEEASLDSNSQMQQLAIQADELALQRKNTERQLRIGIRQSLSTMETAMRTYDAASAALRSAEKAYDIASKSYEVGKTTFTDLNNTELTLTQTRLQQVQAIYNFVIAKAGLEQTLGYDFTEEK